MLQIRRQGQALAALLVLGLGATARAQTPPWWNADYTQRVPVTINRPAGITFPTANQTAEVSIDPLPLNFRQDFNDIRVAYWSGSAWQELDRQVLLEASSADLLTENTNAGSTGYANLPAGTKVTETNINGDDGGATVTLPFSFPFAGASYNQVFFSIDGYLTFGPNQPISLYGRGNVTPSAKGIFPFTSDYTTLIPGTGLYYYADSTKAVFRWEVAQSGGTDVIGKFAAVLYPNGDIRLVYGDPVKSPSAAIADPNTQGSYAEVAVGVAYGTVASSKITFPTFPADYTNHADILYTQNLSASANAGRVVFRLVSPLNDGGTSTGQYFIYTGAASPSVAPSNPKNIYDYVVDFLDPKNVVDQAAPDWTTFTTNESVIVKQWKGHNVGVMEHNSQISHGRAYVKDGAMPKFLNLESYSRIAPFGGGEDEQAVIVRVPQTDSTSAGSTGQGGGYAYGTDAFGTHASDHLISYINPTVDKGPADLATGPYRPGYVNTFENIIFRVDGQILNGKAWKDAEPQPVWAIAGVDRTQLNVTHGSTTDPIYSDPGGVGVGSYTQDIWIDFIALRELGDKATTAAAETAPAATSRIAGTVTGPSGAVSGATVTIKSGATTVATVTTGASGAYQVSLPAGTYDVTVSAPAYAEQTVTGVTAAATGTTNVSLTFNGSVISGTVRMFPEGIPSADTWIALVDANGALVATSRTDASGKYSVTAPGPGTYSVAALTIPANPPGPYTNRTYNKSDRQVVTTTAGTPVTQNLTVRNWINGDFEVPDPNGGRPAGWESYDYTRSLPDAEMRYTTEQNHTPGGHYSIGVIGSDGGDAWMANIPYAPWNRINPNFNRHFSVWVYFTAVGQTARMQLRVYKGSTAVSGPDNTTVNMTSTADMVNKWNELTADVPANPDPDNMDIRLRGEGGGGSMYFDDLTITETPIAVATGKVVDQSGQPVANAIVGPVAQVAGAFPDDAPLLQGPFTLTDENGNFNYYASAAGNITLGGWKVPSFGQMPDYGFIEGTASVNAQPTPPAPVTLTIKPAANIADNGTAKAGNTPGANDRGQDASMPPKNAIDNNLDTRWASSNNGANTDDMYFTVDLGAVKSIDQIEIFWEVARPASFSVSVSDDATNLEKTQVFYTGGGDTPDLGLHLGYSGEGVTQVIKLKAATNARYVTIHPTLYTTGLGNYSIKELRVLSLAEPLPFTTADVQTIIRIVGGLSAAPATGPDFTRLDTTGDGKITIEDAVKGQRTLSGK